MIKTIWILLVIFGASGTGFSMAFSVRQTISMVQQLPDLPDTGALIDPDHPMIFRGDVVEHHYDRKELLANAPQVKAGCVVVPKVVE